MAQKKKQEQSEQDKPIISKKPINYTLCIPTTIIKKSNAKNLQQITSILYQVAKAASIYNVGEIVIMDTFKEIQVPVDLSSLTSKDASTKKIKFDDIEKKEEAEKEVKDSVTEEAMTIATILQYFVTPPYLVKSIFRQKFFKNFQYAKEYPKLTTLPFMSETVESKYREGLTVQMGRISKPQSKAKKPLPLKTTKYVNIGYDKYLELEGQQVPTNVRVTVDTESKKVVSPIEAYSAEQVGAKSSYGYHVRIAKSFTSIFTESSFPEGYSQSIWINSGDIFGNSKKTLKSFQLSKEKEANLLLVLGKWIDIEGSFEQDSKNLEGVQDAGEFFDGELSIPSGTRIEDGAIIALTKLSSI